MNPRRDSRGVRIRADGKGDGWARAHRQLGATFNMTDFDGLMGLVAFAANTGEKLFMEYVPDNYRNRLNLIRQFAIVAMFDRKASREYAFSEANRVSLSWHLTSGESGHVVLAPPVQDGRTARVLAVEASAEHADGGEVARNLLDGSAATK